MARAAARRMGAEPQGAKEPRTQLAGPSEADLALAQFGTPAPNGRISEATRARRQTPANDARPAPPRLDRRGFHIEAQRLVHWSAALDWLFVLVAAECAARWGGGLSLTAMPLPQAASFLAAAGALKAGLWLTRTYRQPPDKVDDAVAGLAIGAILGIGAALAFAPDASGAAALAAVLPLTALALAGVRAALAVWTAAARRAGMFAETVVLVGASPAARRMAERAGQSGEVRIVAVFDDRLARAPASVAGAPVVGDIDALLKWEGLPFVDRVVVAVTQQAESRVRDIIASLRPIPNAIDLLLDHDMQSVRGKGLHLATGLGVARVANGAIRTSFAKRSLDLAVGTLLLALAALPIAAIALAIRAEGKSPVFRRVQRLGLNNRPFSALIFSTWRGAAPMAPARLDDASVTRVGRFLARAGLHELPMLLNVLIGEMALVGPRPHPPGMKAAGLDVREIVPQYSHRHRVKPGLFSWAAVNGARGPLKTLGAARKQIKLDLDYAARASLWLDLQILARVMLRAR